MAVDNDFELLTPTEVSENFVPEESTPENVPTKIRKLCACGCGEEVTGNRALKRGHQMGEGLSPSVFGGNDIIVFQMAMVAFVGALTNAIDNRFHVPPMEAEEIRGIGEPLGRITARHIPKAILKRMKPGDAADAVAIVMISSAYILRITSQKKEKETPDNGSNGYINDQAVSGLGQYSYRPPEVQILQQQNGASN